MRTVRIDLSCWSGYSIGASHYYVRIMEEGQGGRTFRSKFDTYEAARDYINGIIEEHFATGYEFESTGETRFVYVHDGD